LISSNIKEPSLENFNSRRAASIDAADLFFLIVGGLLYGQDAVRIFEDFGVFQGVFDLTRLAAR
jgi:hypothetical protein